MVTLAKRSLGQTGLAVSLLALGTVKLGRNTGVKYPQAFDLPDDATALRLLDVARDLGLNLLDTAPAYGSSESRLGDLLRNRRQDWVLATKVGEEFDGAQSHYDFSPEACTRSVERSLRRLRTDHIDLVLIHSDGNDEEILLKAGTLDALQSLKQRGLIRYSGISHKDRAGAACAIGVGIAGGVDVIMATLNRDLTDEQALIEQASEAGIGVLIKKALSSGHGKAEDLRFVADSPGVSSIVVGTTNPDHLRENVALLQT